MQTTQEGVERAPQCRALCRDFEMAARLGAVHTAAAQKRTAQIRRTAALFPQKLHIRARAQCLAAREKAKACQKRRDTLPRCNVDNVCAAAQLRRALHRNRSRKCCVHRTQQTDHAARNCGTCCLEAQPEAMLPIRHHGRPHAQECGEFRRAAAVTLCIRARERVFYIRGKRRHFSSPADRKSYA